MEIADGSSRKMVIFHPFLFENNGKLAFLIGMVQIDYYPLVITISLPLKMGIEKVDLSMNNCDFPVRSVSLPEGMVNSG